MSTPAVVCFVKAGSPDPTIQCVNGASLPHVIAAAKLLDARGNAAQTGAIVEIPLDARPLEELGLTADDVQMIVSFDEEGFPSIDCTRGRAPTSVDLWAAAMICEQRARYELGKGFLSTDSSRDRIVRPPSR